MVFDRTLYDILGVDTNADEQTVSKVYLRKSFFHNSEYLLLKAVKAKSLEHHPDRGGSVEMVKNIRIKLDKLEYFL